MKKNLFNQVADEMCKISWRKEMRQALKKVLSPAEQMEVGKRWEIQRLKKLKWSQRKIARAVGVSRPTVAKWD